MKLGPAHSHRKLPGESVVCSQPVGVLEGDKKEKGAERIFLKSPKFDERHLYKHSRSSVNSK